MTVPAISRFLGIIIARMRRAFAGAFVALVAKLALADRHFHRPTTHRPHFA